MQTHERHRALKLAAAFLAFGVFWVLFSDAILAARGLDTAELSRLQTYKGWLFVVAGAAFVYVVVDRELHRRVAAERELEFHAHLLEQVGQAVIATDRERRITYWNRAAERLFGWRAGEVLGRDILEVTPSDEALAQAESAFAALETFGEWTGESTLRRRDGSVFPAVITDQVLHDSTGAITGYLGVKTDISQLHSAYAAIRERDNRFRAIIEQASEVTTTLKADGLIDYASPAASRLLGWEQGTFDDQNMFESVLIHPDDRAIMIAAFERLKAAPGAKTSVEARVLRSDGEYVLMEHRGHNLLHEPGVGSIVVHSTDITQRARLEEELRQSQKMEAVGRLAGGIAHDFNNILTAILGHVELLLADMQDDPRSTDALQIQQSAQRATQLTRQLLAFSRKQILRPAVLDLNEVVGDTEGMLARLIGEHYRLELVLQSPLATVRADRSQVEQVLLNLVVNARDAMPAGGTIAIRTSGVVIENDSSGQGVPSGSYVLLEVEDNGAGIDAAVLPRIFEPFFTTKPAGYGTGLGLSTVYGVIQQSGGHVRVRSEPGRGTAFSIYLPPASEPAEPRAAAVTPAPRETAAGRILVVEDDVAVRAFVTRMLRRHGYEVLEAPSPADALSLISGGELVDIVISDVVMPEMNGFELATRIRALRAGLPLLLMSGYAEDTIPSSDAEYSGKFPMIEKPFTADQLLAAIRRAVGSS